MPPPSRKMISSANWWAMARALSSVGFAVLLAKHLRRLRILHVIKPALHAPRPGRRPGCRKPAWWRSAAGCSRLQVTSSGAPGTAAGRNSCETMSKMPAWSRSLQSVSLKVEQPAVCASVAGDLKSGTARRIFSRRGPCPCGSSPAAAEASRMRRGQQPNNAETDRCHL